MLALTPGTTFGSYRISNPVGHPGDTLRPWCPGFRPQVGGNDSRKESASVYIAHLAADRQVALKVLPAECLQHPECSFRLEQEAAILAQLSHRNIVVALDLGRESDRLYMAMTPIAGGALSRLLGEGRLKTSHALAILHGVATALDYVHGKGVVHRNVAPQNILLGDAGHPFLADFCIAKRLKFSVEWIGTDVVTGTPPYMAPEQVGGFTADQSSDIYALGVVAYEMFTGRRPFEGTNLMHKIVHEPAPPPRHWNKELRPRCDEIFASVLAKNPHERYPSASAFVSALEEGLAP
jgi:serine/threonine protein kinase